MAVRRCARDAQCLLAYDDRGDTVAVWSAGPGKPGLLEPMGVHREHRGRGHGKAIAAAAAESGRLPGSRCGGWVGQRTVRAALLDRCR